MDSLKELKGRINSVKSTQKITKAKQMVAAAKLRKAQAAAEAGRPYAERLNAVMASLAGKVVYSKDFVSDGSVRGGGARNRKTQAICSALSRSTASVRWSAWH